MTDYKLAIGSWCVGGMGDRYTSYTAAVPLAEQIKRVAAVDGVTGIELVYPFENQPVAEVKKMVAGAGLKVAGCICGPIIGPPYQNGSLSDADLKLWASAIDEAKKSMDAVSELDGDNAALWLGQDGFDYPFQVDYRVVWDRLVHALEQLADHNPALNIVLEYKPKEPRTHSLIANIGKALALCAQVNKPNLGVLIDFGHALMGEENVAESVILTAMHHRPMHIHFNDNYAKWDDDMIVGSIHPQETLEFLLALKQTNYQGWVSLDQFPFREDPVEASRLSIKNLKALMRMANHIDLAALAEAQSTMDAIASQTIISNLIFGE
jgi:xylose isomerase